MARPATETRRALQPLTSALDAHLALRMAGGAILCVSGGSDSRALLESAARWPGRFSGALAVASVDHGTRASSAGEARAVLARAGALGFTAHLLAVAPSSMGEGALRQARYHALIALARRLGLGALVVAHHAGDVAEGAVLSWLGTGGGPGGAAPPRVTDHDGIVVVRPFLDLSRATLRTALAAVGALDWFTDPDATSERARARTVLATLGRGRDLEAPLARAATRRREDEGVLAAAATSLLVELPGATEVRGPAAPALLRRALEAAVRSHTSGDPRGAARGVAAALGMLARGRAGRVDLVGAHIDVTPSGVATVRPAAVADGPAATHDVPVTPLARTTSMRTVAIAPQPDALPPDEQRTPDEQP